MVAHDGTAVPVVADAGIGWIRPTDRGLYVRPGGCHIDPVRPVDRAVVTRGHADHAPPDNRHVLATPETLAIMRARDGDRAGGTLQPLAPGGTVAAR